MGADRPDVVVSHRVRSRGAARADQAFLLRLAFVCLLGCVLAPLLAAA
jgi:hypothetical protein